MGIIVFLDNLQISANISNSAEILNMLRENEYCPGIYLVCYALNPSNLLDIYHAPEIIKPYYNQYELKVVAICSSKEDAIETSIIIIKKMLESNNCNFGNDKTN